MKVLTIIFVACFVLVSCHSKSVAVHEEERRKDVEQIEELVLEREGTSREVIQRLSQIGLVNLQNIDSNIQVDLRYASTDNFMNTLLYDTLKDVFLQQEVAERLSKVQRYLDSIKPGYRLKVYDGVRPLLVQTEMWNALDSVPTTRRGKYVSNPKSGSVHNFGAAVDLTIVDSNGVELNMGAGYDDFRDIAFPSKEAQFLEEGLLSKEQVNNRRLLRRVMRSQRFYNIPSEWWHFNAYSRITASKKFELLYSESGVSFKREVAPKIEAESDSLQGVSNP